jgi:hypothetical protein
MEARIRVELTSGSAEGPMQVRLKGPGGESLRQAQPGGGSGNWSADFGDLGAIAPEGGIVMVTIESPAIHETDERSVDVFIRKRSS